MGLFSAIVLFPLAPVRGVVALAGVIQRQVEQEMHDPAITRRQLEELQELRERGEISAEEEREAQQKILQTRIGSGAPERTPPESG